MISAILVALFAITGAVLLAGGVYLASLGGSLSYLLMGLAYLLVAVLWPKRPAYALIAASLALFGILVWAIWEVGFDWWSLMPRGGVPVLLALFMLVAWWRRRDLMEATHPGSRGAGMTLAAIVAGTFIVAAYSMTGDSFAVHGTVAKEATALPPSEQNVPAEEWLAYGRTKGGSHFSPLDDITPQNVSNLVKAWEYHTGDIRQPDDTVETTYEVTPTMVDGLLYLCTPHHLAIALDPVTGEEKWRFDAKIGANKMRQHQTCRGLTYYRLEAAPSDAECSARVLLPTSDARLIALDAKTGKPCAEFGDQGSVNLAANMPHMYEGAYYSTSPPVAARGLIVIGGAVNDNVSTTEPSGVIRAYDARNGQLVWNFDSGNPDQTQPIAPDKTYVGNSPNAWSILSVDEDLGLVYAPMGNAPPDQFGGNRTAETERFSSSVTALDLMTGQVRWVFQTVHHDLWDMDVPSQPQLVDISTADGIVPAIVQATKQGDIYVLDRRDGRPIVPVQEQPAPKGAAEGDFTAPTQPVSAMTFRPEPLREADMWGATIFDQLWCRVRFRTLNYDGQYTPPSTNGTIVYPGNFGTFNWGGVAIDPSRQVVIANPVYLAFLVTLIPRADDTKNYVSEGEPGFNENYGAPFAAMMRPFWSPIGLPCQRPPWGYIAAADLQTGKVLWMHRNGTVRDLAPIPLPFAMGVPGIGGPIVTAGGVAFHSGTLDYYVRAFNVTDGQEIWRDRLPAGGQATPMTYRGQDGRQYVVVVAGGHGSTGTAAGDAVLAYALPK